MTGGAAAGDAPVGAHDAHAEQAARAHRTDRSPRVLVVAGSPHEGGKSTELAKAVVDDLARYGVAVTFHHLAGQPIVPCTNCGVCQVTGRCRIAGDAWPTLARHMEDCELMFLIAPVYFAGPSAPLKAMLDRCQVFWARKYVLGRDVPSKRPCHLLVVGDGGDPFGSQPLEAICTSALNCANLRVGENIHRFIGEDYDLGRVPTIVRAALEGRVPAAPGGSTGAGNPPQSPEASEASGGAGPARRPVREDRGGTCR